MNADINQQIFWLEGQIKHMKRSLPDAVASGRMSGVAATYKLTAACGCLMTLTQLRGLTRTNGLAEAAGDGNSITPAMQFERGAAAARAGRSRDSHCMNPGAQALKDWYAGYDSVGRAEP